jgi:hypothetical protein
MSLNIVSEVWDVLREHLDFSSRSDAADALVNLLIENNFEVDEIKDAFKDKEITAALKGYTDEHFPDEEYEEDEDNDDEDNDW